MVSVAQIYFGYLNRPFPLLNSISNPLLINVFFYMPKKQLLNLIIMYLLCYKQKYYSMHKPIALFVPLICLHPKSLSFCSFAQYPCMCLILTNFCGDKNCVPSTFNAQPYYILHKPNNFVLCNITLVDNQFIRLICSTHKRIQSHSFLNKGKVLNSK